MIDFTNLPVRNKTYAGANQVQDQEITQYLHSGQNHLTNHMFCGKIFNIEKGFGKIKYVFIISALLEG